MKEDLVDIFEAATVIEAKLLADRLDSEGIRNFMDNTNSPLGGLTLADQNVVVRVMPADEARAKRVVEEFQAETSP